MFPRLRRIAAPLTLALVATLGPMLGGTGAATASGGSFDISATVSSPNVVGVPMSYTLTATNISGDMATSVSVFLNFPPGLKLNGLPANCAREGAGGTTTVVGCLVGTLPSGANGSATITLVPQVAGTFDSTAWASGYVGGVGSTSGTVDLITQIAPAPTDVQVTGFASTGSPAVGSTFTYTYQVKDNGPQPAYGVSFADTLPSSLTYVGATTSIAGQTCVLSSGQVSCGLGDLAVGAQGNVTITVIAPTTPTTITDTATVSSTVPDTQPSNNAVNVTVQVK